MFEQNKRNNSESRKYSKLHTKKFAVELSDIQKEDHSHYDAEVVPFTVTIRSKTSRTQDDILSIIRRMEGIKYFEVI